MESTLIDDNKTLGHDLTDSDNYNYLFNWLSSLSLYQCWELVIGIIN